MHSVCVCRQVLCAHTDMRVLSEPTHACGALSVTCLV